VEGEPFTPTGALLGVEAPGDGEGARPGIKKGVVEVEDHRDALARTGLGRCVDERLLQEVKAVDAQALS
jgi:hypothetical protein